MNGVIQPLGLMCLGARLCSFILVYLASIRLFERE